MSKIVDKPIDKSEFMIIIVIIIIVMIAMMHPDEVQVTNRGQTFNLSRAIVEASLLNVTPERVTKYGVVVHGQEYPVIQVLAVATGVPKIEWATVNAYRILQKLGFEIRVHE